MLETLLGVAKNMQRYFPDSGPGSKWLLRGNDVDGYFGEVTAKELVSGSELFAKTQLPTGQIYKDNDQIWLKFFRDRKVIYIAKTPVVVGLSWDQAYANGLVYGTKDTGPFTVTSPVEQFKTISAIEGNKTHHLLIRLPMGNTEDPGINIEDSEWNKTFFKVVSGLGSEEYASYPPAELSRLTTDNELFMQSSISPGYYMRRRLIGAAHVNHLKNDVNCVWRPVLELITSENVILALENEQGSVEGLEEPLINTVTPIYSESLRPIRTVVQDSTDLLSPQTMIKVNEENISPILLGQGSVEDVLVIMSSTEDTELLNTIQDMTWGVEDVLPIMSSTEDTGLQTTIKDIMWGVEGIVPIELTTSTII